MTILMRIALILLIAMAQLCVAQTIATGEVTGTITDPAGKAVANASVQLKSAETGESRTGPANDSGVYRFTFLKPGTYDVSATSANLVSDQGKVTVGVGRVEIVDVAMKIKTATTSIEVRDEWPLLNTDNANTVYSFSSRQLELLPLPGGDLVSVAYSIPGVAFGAQGGFGGSFAANGLGGVSNLFTVNGIDDMDPYYNRNNSGATGLLLGVSEVQEASIVLNPYEGQYGRQAGAQVNYVTKSGSNVYHGNLAYSYNGNVLNANDFFSNRAGLSRPHTVSNQYAASLGGPVLKDKLFFFADTEGLRFALPTSGQVVAIPSAAFQSYALRTIQPSQVSLYQQMFAAYNSAPGVGKAVPVTTGTGPLQDSGGGLGCGSLAGTPTGTGGTFGVDTSCANAWATNTVNQDSEWLLSTRVDYNLSDRQHLFLRFKTDHGQYVQFQSLVNPLFSAGSTEPDYEGQVNHTFAISPRLVNNFIGAVTYNDYIVGFSDLDAAVKVFPAFIRVIGGYFSPIGAFASYPQGRRLGQLQLNDDLSYEAGRHSLKAGINYRYNRESDVTNGEYASRGLYRVSMSDLASGVVGPSDSYQQNFTANPTLHLRLYNAGFYLQDQWAVTPHLKITAAIRFERTGNPYCPDQCFSRLVSPFSEIAKGTSIPYNQTIQSNLDHAFYRVEPLIPEPRVGVVYAPEWAHGTILRGGIGVYSDSYPAWFVSSLAQNAPAMYSSVIHTGLINVGGPGSALAIAAASANAFETQFASGATFSQLQQATAGQFSAPSYYSVPSTLRTPKYVEWSLDLERRIGTRNSLTLRYAGNHGYDIFLLNGDANAFAPPGSFPNGIPGLPQSIPDPRFSAVAQFTNGGYSNYDAFITAFRRSFGRLQGQISYTWSHTLDTASNNGLATFNNTPLQGQINPANPASLNYGNADYDIRHNVTGDLIWDSPVKFGNRLLNLVLGGWSIGERINAHTGTPFSVINSNVFVPNSLFGTARADVSNPNIATTCGGSAVSTPCFSTSQFVAASKQTDIGNLPRNSFRGPRFFDIDSTLYKTVSLGERARVTIGVSAYNLLNHPNFANPSSDVHFGSFGGFGQITSTVGPPSSPYGSFGGSSARTVVVTGKLAF